jgi:pentose-5-phosphate-3-epimerase
MNNIIPALLETSFHKLHERMERVYPLVDTIQIDLCDGDFVDSTTWPYTDDMPLTGLHQLRKFFDKVELDLMIKDPIPGQFAALYPHKIVLHWNSFDYDAGQEYFTAFRQATQELGLAIPATLSGYQLDKVVDFLRSHNQFDYVQIMGIKVRGRQRQHFYEPVVDTIREFQTRAPEYPIQIDGGMNPKSVAIVRQYGIDTMVAGSSIWDSESIEGAIQKMQSVVI